MVSHHLISIKKTAGKIMKVFIFAILLTVITQFANANSLTSSVDRHQLTQGETFTLIITYDDAKISGQPNLGGLDNSFEVLNSSSSSETRIINGSVNSQKKWRYVLIPKKTGNLLIPSFSIKDSYSEPIEIIVHETSGSMSNNKAFKGDLFIESSVDKREAYIQEMITLTLRIYTSVQIAQPKIIDLALPGFMIEKLGESQFETRESDRNYYVLEYRYALFALQSGDFVIPKQRYQIAQIISNGPRSLFDIRDFGTQTQARFLSTSDIPIRVNSAASSNSADYWFPSDDVTLTDNWEIDQGVEIGTPITRTIEVKSLGSIASNIPPLNEYAVKNIKTYAEQPVLTNDRVRETLLGTRRETRVIVPVEPGEYLLPEIQINWWSNKEKIFKTSSLPARKLIVTGAIDHTRSVNDASATHVSERALFDTDQKIAPQQTYIPFYLNVYLWIGISVFLFTGLLVAIVMYISHKKDIAINLEPKPPGRAFDAKKELREIKDACLKNDAKRARSGLIQWGKIMPGNDSLLTLEDLKNELNHPVFDEIIRELDSSLYKQNGDWSGNRLLEFLRDSGDFEELPSRNTHAHKPSLPGLYD